MKTSVLLIVLLMVLLLFFMCRYSGYDEPKPTTTQDRVNDILLRMDKAVFST